MDGPALVIGGTRGTGRLVAHLLLERGSSVRVLARNPDRARRTLDGSVELVRGDITRPWTLPAAVQGVAHIIFTAGVHSGRLATQRQVRLTDYQGVLNTMQAAQAAGFKGRFLYLNSIGVTVPSMSAAALNLLKRNTLLWRRRVEQELRASTLDYTVIRVGFLRSGHGGRREIQVSQTPLPLALRHRIDRADVAETFVEALSERRTSRTTFDIVWGPGPRLAHWDARFAGLRPDQAPAPSNLRAPG